LLTPVVSKVPISNLERVYSRDNFFEKYAKMFIKSPPLFTKQYIATMENVVVNVFYFYFF